MNTHRIGRGFERVAEAALVDAGWTIMGRNVRFRRKEIDLIVRRGRLVAFVEVKGRRGIDRGDPLDAITALKRREIESVARWWVSRFGPPGADYRFDAVAVRAPGAEGGRLEIEHVENAWREGE